MEQAETRALRAIQDELRRLITAPDGVASGPALDALIRADLEPGPVERLGVYANAYFARLHDCLREDFGALARALGPEAFHDLVKTYLMMHPPTRPSLVHAGAQLAEHLAEEPFAGIFSRRCPYAADLARLEWAMAEAFCAADAPALARDDLASADPSELRLEPVPSLRLLSSAWPVDRVREQFDGEPADRVWDGSPPLPAEPTGLRIWRRDERVRYRAIGQLEYEALGAAIAGEPFAAICERVARSVGAADAAPRAAELLARWTADGLFARPRLSA